MRFSLSSPRDSQIRCPKCDKRFLKSNHLKKHLNSHDGRRDYICEKCSKAFLTKYHLTRHLKICKGPPQTSRGRPQNHRGTRGGAEEEEEEDDEEEEEEEER